MCCCSNVCLWLSCVWLCLCQWVNETRVVFLMGNKSKIVFANTKQALWCFVVSKRKLLVIHWLSHNILSQLHSLAPSLSLNCKTNELNLVQSLYLKINLIGAKPHKLSGQFSLSLFSTRRAQQCLFMLCSFYC